VNNKHDNTIIGVNSQSNTLKIWSTDIKTINFSENKRKSSSIFRPRTSEKENSIDSHKKNFGFINQERRTSFIGDAQKILQQKHIDINLNQILDPNQLNNNYKNTNQVNKQRSKTPQTAQMIDKNFMKNIQQNQNIPLLTKTLSSEYSSTPQKQELKKEICDVGKRILNVNPIRERGNHQRIEEVSAECETSIMNFQKGCNEELKLSSFLIDNETSDKCSQFDLINEVNYFSFISFKYLQQSFLLKIVLMV